MAGIKAELTKSPRPEVLTLDNSALLLKCVLYIYHLVRFKNDQVKVQALLKSNSKVNAMTPAYGTKLGLKV